MALAKFQEEIERLDYMLVITPLPTIIAQKFVNPKYYVVDPRHASKSVACRGSFRQQMSTCITLELYWVVSNSVVTHCKERPNIISD